MLDQRDSTEMFVNAVIIFNITGQPCADGLKSGFLTEGLPSRITDQC